MAKQLIDHRIIGANQKLFFFDPFSKGSCFFLPKGTQLYNKLMNHIKSECNKRNYQEVITPNIFSDELWKTSNHWQHYAENIIPCKVRTHNYSLKPMNCPAHCLIYKNMSPVKIDDLPLRLCEFGILHRNELTGSLTGLTRLRKFVQDDAHIFCTDTQIGYEIEECLKFARQIYEQFDLSFQLELSLRPQKFLGDSNLWDLAEDSLRQTMKSMDLNWKETKYEGAFYGPKIDIIIKDSLKRSHQCATIQLDFQLPSLFKLTYKDGEINKQPVIIHRAILGSFERFISMLAENCGGLWPFWLSPCQAQVIPLHSNFNNYAKHIRDKLRKFGFNVDADLDPHRSYNKKIREASLHGYNFLLIVGKNEEKSEKVTIRVNRNPSMEKIDMKLDSLVDFFSELDSKKCKTACEIIKTYRNPKVC